MLGKYTTRVSLDAVKQFLSSFVSYSSIVIRVSTGAEKRVMYLRPEG